MTKSVDDVLIPGTLNVGDTVPVCIEAFLFFDFVPDMDLLTLVSMIVASIAGAYLAAGVVSKFNRKKVRYAMGVAMLLLATVMFMRWAGIGPFGELGTATGLRGIKLIIAIVVNFILGGLMSIGVGLYAPCMALCVILGLDTGCAFPAMMGSCAYLMAFGNSPKFIQEGRYDPVACWTQALGGAVGVFLAFFIVKSLSLRTLTLVVVIVCSSLSFSVSSFRSMSQDRAQTAVESTAALFSVLFTSVPGTPLLEEAQRGEFDPLSEKEMLEELKTFAENLDVDCTFITHHTISGINLTGPDFLKRKDRIVGALEHEIKHGDMDRLAAYRRNKRTL